MEGNNMYTINFNSVLKALNGSPAKDQFGRTLYLWDILSSCLVNIRTTQPHKTIAWARHLYDKHEINMNAEDLNILKSLILNDEQLKLNDLMRVQLLEIIEETVLKSINDDKKQSKRKTPK